MSPRFPNRLLVAGLILVATATVRPADEGDLLVILKSAAGVTEKCDACRALRLCGTVESVPQLAALLTEERLGHAARYALEGLPFPEAGAALRNAIGKTSGLIQAGLIDSVGWRRDAAAVSLLAPFLASADKTVAEATAGALGRIGNRDALAALQTARNNPDPTLRTVVLNALLLCAEQHLKAGDQPTATALYSDVFDAGASPAIRAAAWRGWVLSDVAGRPNRIAVALADGDQAVRVAALKLVRELNDPLAVSTAVASWDALDPEARLAVLEAHVQLGTQALPTVRRAAESPDLAVRVAAWRALAGLNDVSMISALAQAAERGETVERDAARHTLARMTGPGIHEALLACLDEADSPAKAEILRALGERGNEADARVLLRYASAPERAVRIAALESLGRLAAADTLPALLDLAVAAETDADRALVLKALYRVCEASPDKARAGRQVVTALNRLSVSERRHLLPLLSELGTPEALAAAIAASRETDPDLVRESVQVLSQWPDATAAPPLFDLAGRSTDPSVRTLALRAGITVAGRESDPSARLVLLRSALTLADRPEEKVLALGELGRIALPEAIEVAVPYLDDPALADEAGLAVIGIAEALADERPELANELAAQVLLHSQVPAIVKRAWMLRNEAPAGGPFIRDWLVCGPYRQAGLEVAAALFDLAFGPEQPGKTLRWQPVPAGDTVNLAAIFPHQANCVAYLKTEILAPADVAALLLMGSDDGIKVWLNGAVVHANNVDRGMVVDGDLAPIELERGSNELLLKITQGGGGWSACARILGTDGRPLDGLRVRLPDSSD